MQFKALSNQKRKGGETRPRTVNGAERHDAFFLQELLLSLDSLCLTKQRNNDSVQLLAQVQYQMSMDTKWFP